MKIKPLRIFYKLSKYGISGIILPLLLVELLLVSNAYSNNIEKIWDTHIGLAEKKVTIVAVFDKIQKKTGVSFKYDKKELAPSLSKTVFIHKTNATVAEILTGLSQQENLSFRQVNRDIVVEKINEKGKHNYPFGPTAREVLVEGKITDLDGVGLAGVNVIIKGTSEGTVSDVDGNYKISVPDENAVLVFSFIGYELSEATVGNQSTIDIVMLEDITALSEIVVVGYGTVKKSDLTGSVASIKAEAIREFPITSVDQAIQSRVAGVNVVQSSSAPGGGLSVRIRGANSINSGSEPLYVIDGFPIYPDNEALGTSGNRSEGNILSTLNPNDIASIEVLKDASATSIYGSRGGNGVVLITTKRGKEGQSKINFEHSSSIQTISNRVDRLNASEYAQYRNLLEESVGGIPIYTQDEIDALGEGTDWVDEIIETGAISNTQLTFTGGNEDMKYAVAGNYFKNDGIVKGSGFERYGARLNLDNNALDDFITVNTSVSFNRSVTTSQATDRQSPGDGGIMITALGLDPTVAVKDAAGAFNLPSYDGRSDINPVQEAENVQDQDFTNRFLGTGGITFHPMEGLSVKTSIGADIINANRITFLSAENTFLGRQRVGSLENFTRYVTNLLNENVVSYTRSFGEDHNIDAVLGYTYQHIVNRFSFVSTWEIPGTSVDNVNLGNGNSPQIPQSGRASTVLKSLLGRVNYKFKGRYLLTLTFRRDGFSGFAANNKWGTFPSAALGWRIIDEPFMGNVGILSDLKLRVSYGVTGNSNQPPYLSQAGLSPNNYVLGGTGGTLISGVVEERLPNDGFKWESTKMFNIGIDAGVLENKLSFTADYFITRTGDLILDVSLPGSTGFSTATLNSGLLENKGFELGINAIAIDKGEFRWDIDANLAVLRNEIIDLGFSTPFFADMDRVHLGVNGSWVEVGNPIGVWRGYKMIGLWQTQEEIDNNPSLPNDKPGYPRYQDTDNDGDIDPDDYDIIGDPNPDFTWGLNTTLKYKGFDFGLFLRGVHGNDVRNLQASELGDGVQIINQLSNILTDSWSTANTEGTRPLIDRNRDFSSLRNSDFFIEDGSFIRVQNIVLGYTLPKVKYLTSMRVYLSAQNPIVITDYNGFDPEVNNMGQDNLNRADDYDAYPRAKIFTAGVNLGF